MLKKTKITKQKSIWNNKLEKNYQKELENSSKISVIKERLKKNVGKVVYVIYSKDDDLLFDIKGKLTEEFGKNNFQVESESLDYIIFALKHIKRISENKFTTRIHLKL